MLVESRFGEDFGGRIVCSFELGRFVVVFVWDGVFRYSYFFCILGFCYKFFVVCVGRGVF